MLRRPRREDITIERFWAALRADRSAARPDDLDARLAGVVRRLEGEARPPEPSDAFVDRLWHDLDARADELDLRATTTTTPRPWSGPAVDVNSIRPARPASAAAAEDQIMSASTDRPVSLEERRWSKELWKFAAAIAVFAVVGALLVLLLRDDDEPEVAQPVPTATPTVVEPTPSVALPTATVAAIVPTSTVEAVPTATVSAPTATAEPTEKPSPTPSGPVIGEVVATIAVGGGPEAMAAGAGSIWVANELDGTVSRIDPATNEVIATIEVGSPAADFTPSPPSIAVLGDEVWVLVNTDGTLVRIDPATNDVNASVTLPSAQLPTNQFRGLAAGAGALWVTDDGGPQVIRVDPVSLSISTTIPGINGYGLLATDDAVWVAAYLDTATVYRIDPATNAVVATIEVASGPIKLAAGFDSIWVTNLQAASLTRINPTTNEVIDTISVQRVNPQSSFPEVRDLAVDEHGVWVGDVRNGGLYLINPAPNGVIRAMQTDPISSIVALDGSIWIADWENGVVSRIDPAR